MLVRDDGPWADALVVDVGIGTPPDATIALHAAVRTVAPRARTIAVDVVPAYLDALVARAQVGIEGRLGGDALPIRAGEAARVVRAVNLLRRAHPSRIDAALATLAAPLLPGGWLIEGSTDTDGDVGVVRVLARDGEGLVPTALVVFTTFARGFDPRLFTAWLPRGLGRHARPGPALAERFARWAAATGEARQAGHRDPPGTFVAAAERLAATDPAVVVDPEGWAGGVLWWDEAPRPDAPPGTR